MNSIVKPYLFRASILAAIAIFMGLILSFMVYKSTESVRVNAIDLVEYRIPILTGINELISDLSEQERVVYEYYRSQNDEVFLSSSKNIAETFNMHFSVILAQPRFASEAKIIAEKQNEISQLFELFYQEMQVQDDNWDEMRSILQAISQVRIELLPTLKSIEKQTKLTVEEGHSKTLSQMFIAHWLVVVYGLFIILIAGVVSWYIRQYILNQAKTTRLALFSQRNPNPILSVNNLGEVTFANPACENLLHCVGISPEKVDELLPANFLSLRQSISQQVDSSLVVEQRLKDRILQISIHWHKELEAYDIHIKDITERVLAEQEVKKLAFTSPETHLPNLYKLNEKITELIEHNRKFSLGVLALRHFNEKVGTFGGEVVSALVRCFANLITKHLPKDIGFYHINESEFAIVCTETLSTLSLQKLVKNISKEAEKALVTKYGEFFIECDFGFVVYPEHGADHNILLKNAHIALSLASKNEHENYCLFTPIFADKIEKSATMVDKLRHAITLDELFLVFQPQFSFAKNKITGIETLVRWRHSGEIISPAEFIPLAEKSGLIVSIGQWILEQACLFAKELVKKGYVDIVVAVNVSPRQFSHPQFIQTVKDALIKSDLDASNLELEITEGVFMHNEANTISVLQHLKTLGVELSIDDFGTGYSSLSYLKQFPVDKLKIDQSFIRNCHQNNEDKAIVNTIIGLGKNLGLSLIAEGVEEVAHVEFLKAQYCDEIQGYWFSRPLEKNDLLDFFADKEKVNLQKKYAE
ncbi:EAL domain-containing protein [Colwelliaceae bacterium 6441]